MSFNQDQHQRDLARQQQEQMRIRAEQQRLHEQERLMRQHTERQQQFMQQGMEWNRARQRDQQRWAASGICPSCGHQNRPDAAFCASCGTALAAANGSRRVVVRERTRRGGGSVLRGLLVFLVLAIVLGGAAYAVYVSQREGTAVYATVTEPSNVRRGPGTDNEVIAQLEAGTPITVECRTSSGWSRLLEPNAGGYISGDRVDHDRPPPRC